MACFKVFVESLIQRGSIENSPNMIAKLALIEQHLNETAGPWKKSAISSGGKMFEVNQNGKYLIKMATTHLHVFAHTISQKQTVGL